VISPSAVGGSRLDGDCGRERSPHDEAEAFRRPPLRGVCAHSIRSAGGARGRWGRPGQQPWVSGPPATATATRRVRQITALRTCAKLLGSPLRGLSPFLQRLVAAE
jgi:hypothetical protein